MRVILLILAVAALGYGGYTYRQRTHERHLAPPGVLFLLRYKSVTSATGVTGFAPGTKVSLLRQSGDSMQVTNGEVQFDAPSADFTNDLDIAARAATNDVRAQDLIGRLLTTKLDSILAATYSSGESSLDVTDAVQARVAAGERTIRAGDELGSIDLPWWRTFWPIAWAFDNSKTLTITYALAGNPPVTKTAHEGESITLPAAPPPAVTTSTPAFKAPPRTHLNPLDRRAYNQQQDVARPPEIYYLPPPPRRP